MRKFFSLLLCYGCAALLLSSCASEPGQVGARQDQTPVQPLSCIAVLPASASVAQDNTTIGYAEAQSMNQGAVFATEVMRQELQGNPKVRILSSDQVASLLPEFSGGMRETLTAIGEKLNCDGALLTTVRRFKPREGTEYAAESPASVDLVMALRHTGTGNLLWSAEFEEKQQSFLENIFTFSKMKKRGFKWVTAEQLMEQGIKDRLGVCPYLQ